jgi:hypothetical protein
MGQTLKQLTVPPEYACSLKFHKHINLWTRVHITHLP